MRTELETDRALELYGDMVRRICLMNLKNYADAEDIFQNVFLKYVTTEVQFADENHEKAWFIRVTINACRDLLRSFFRRNVVSLDDLYEEPAESFSSEQQDILELVLSLPPKFKDVIYLHYYEGYSAVEIAEIIGKNTNTVYTHLNRARKILKDKLGGDWNE